MKKENKYKNKNNKNTKILIGAFVILIIAIISFSFYNNKNGINGINKISSYSFKDIKGIKDITGFATKTVESECSPDATCPQECIDNNAQCIEESCDLDECVSECFWNYCADITDPNSQQECYIGCGDICTGAVKYSCSYEVEGGCISNSDCVGGEYCINENCIKSISITDCEGSQPDCNLVYDHDINTRYAKGEKTRIPHWVKLFFNKANIKNIYIYPHNYVKSGKLELSDNQVINTGDLVAFKWNKFEINKDNINNIRFEWISYGYDSAGAAKDPHYTGLYEVVIEPKEEAIEGCTDTDGGKVYDVKGTVTDKYNHFYYDVCAEKTGTGNELSDFTEAYSCSGNDCFLAEYFCGGTTVGVDTNVGFEFVGCNDCNDGVCYDVRTGCEKCGEGLFNKCDKNECKGLGSSCVFIKGTFINDCIDYSKDACESKNTRDECVGENILNDYESECADLTTQTDCENNDICEWFSEAGEAGICAPKARCVWTHGHCCGDGEEWNGVECEPLTQTAGNLCFEFYKKRPGKNEICWNVGSMAYGFWVPVETY